VLDQGKYHQVKRMLAATGHHCDALVRTAIGKLKLEQLDLQQGKWCFLNEAQLSLLAPSPASAPGEPTPPRRSALAGAADHPESSHWRPCRYSEYAITNSINVQKKAL
jgi:hypothetical protein